MWFHIIIEFTPMLFISHKQIESDNYVFSVRMGCVWWWKTHEFCLQLRQVEYRFFDNFFLFFNTSREFLRTLSYTHWNSVPLPGFSPVVASLIPSIPVRFSTAEEEYGANTGARLEDWLPPKRTLLGADRWKANWEEAASISSMAPVHPFINRTLVC